MRKNNKSALILSALSLLLSVSMLVGSTFAWFTDNASVQVNTIQAGTLDIDLLDENNQSLDGKTLGFLNVENPDNVLWEPGARFQLQEVTLVNKGSLAVKYKLVLSYTDNDTEDGVDLGKVIDVYIGEKYEGTLYDLSQADMLNESILEKGGEASYGNITLVMQKTAGNEYQGKSLSSVAIKVFATQATVESDSFDDQYDANAEYGWDGKPDYEALNKGTNTEKKTISVATPGALAAFAAKVNDGSKEYQNYTLTLNADIDLGGNPWTPINAWDGALDGFTFDGKGHTIKNMRVEGESNAGFIGSNSKANLVIKNLTFDGAVVKAKEGNGTYSGVVIGYNYAANTLTNVHVKNSKVISNWQCGGLVGINSEYPMTFENCSISDSFVGGYNCTAGAIYGTGAVAVNLTDCSATNVDLYTDSGTTGIGMLVGWTYGNSANMTSCTVTNVNIVSTTPVA